VGKCGSSCGKHMRVDVCSLFHTSIVSALVFALCGGVGATLALASFASLQKEVDLERCPKSFRGVPIQLITAGLMAMALVGYYGLYLE